MKKVFSTLFIGLVSIACREEITPLKPPTDPPLVSSCKAPLLKQNIVGQWHFQTNLGNTNRSIPMREGTVTFSSDGVIIDPDSLFENRLDVGPVVSKTYGVDVMSSAIFPEISYNYPELKKYGPMLWVRLSVKTQSVGIRFAQGWYFKEVSNDCKRIITKHPQETILGDIILTRK